MSQDPPTSQTTGSWRYFAGVGCIIIAAGLAPLGYLAFPHGSPMSDSWTRAMSHTAILTLSAFGSLILGAILIVCEAWRRHDSRVEAACPIDRKAYREVLQHIMHQADRHPRAPIDPKDIRRMLELLEPAHVADSAGYKLLSKEE